MTLPKKLKFYRALLRVGRDNLSDRGIAFMLSLARDPEVMAYYSRHRLNIKSLQDSKGE
jgi:hypothetical protein